MLCKAGNRCCALPVEHVIETLRPLPIEPFREAPEYVPGASVIRGGAVPVVSASALLGAPDTETPQRLVTLRAGPRVVALAVGAVLGVRALDAEELGGGLPPLLGETAGDLASELGALDSALLVVLRGARLVPPEIWEQLDGTEGR